jgi:hypothetical protein
LYGVGRAELLFQQTCGPARTAMSFRDVFVRADIRSRSAGGGRGSMVKTLCIGMTTAACLAIAMAADAADLSMTPIYQTRPSAAATLNGSVKDQSRPGSVPDREHFKLSPGTDAITATGAPQSGRVLSGQVLSGQVLSGQVLGGQVLSGHVFWTGVNDRF